MLLCHVDGVVEAYVASLEPDTLIITEGRHRSDGKVPTWPATCVVLKGSRVSLKVWTKGSAAGSVQHVWRNAPTSSRQFLSWATWAPFIMGIGNCLRTRI